jgi:hypothetical protein
VFSTALPSLIEAVNILEKVNYKMMHSSPKHGSVIKAISDIQNSSDDRKSRRDNSLLSSFRESGINLEILFHFVFVQFQIAGPAQEFSVK